MKEKLLIIGASGHGKVVADIAIKMNRWSNIYFLDDNENIKFSQGISVLGKTVEAYKYIDEFDIFVGIGCNQTREQVQKSLEDRGASVPILIHPNGVIGVQVEIGVGSAIMAGVVINSGTKIGKGCIINTSSSLDHDNIVGDYVHISPGAHLAGTVHVGHGSWLGIGSIISNNVFISKKCRIGAGTVVLNDITDTGTYVGVPARRVNV